MIKTLNSSLRLDKRMKLVLALLLCGAPLAFGAEEHLELKTGLGNGFFLQSVNVQKRFIRLIDDSEQKFLRPDTRKTAAREAKFKPDAETVQVFGEAEYTYFQGIARAEGVPGSSGFNADGIADDTHTGRFGLRTDIYRLVEIGASIQAENLPAENYTQGVLRFDLHYLHAFHPEVEGLDDEKEDYRAYDADTGFKQSDAYEEYSKRQYAKSLPPLGPEYTIFPQLQSAVYFSFHRHSQGNSENRARSQGLSERFEVHQAVTTVEFIYLPKENREIRAAYTSGIISNNKPDDLMAYQTALYYRRQSLTAVSRLMDVSTVLLQFPKTAFDFSYGFDLNPQWHLTAAANWTAYNSEILRDTFGVGAIFARRFNRSFGMKAAGDLTFNKDFSSLTAIGAVQYYF